MQSRVSQVRRALVCGLAAVIALAATAGAQTLLGTNVDSRMLIGFSVPREQVQAKMPKGWTSVAFPDGPLAGANLLVGLEERLFAADAEGKPLAAPTSRGVALMGLAIENGGRAVRLYVLRLYTSQPSYDPFGNAVAARVMRRSSTEGVENAGRRHDEHWSVDLGAGGTLDIAAQFSSGGGAWASASARPYSNVDPTFSRLFEYDQLVELAMSAPAGMPLKGHLDVTTTIPELAGLFDGSERLVAVMNIPVYVRKVFAQ